MTDQLNPSYGTPDGPHSSVYLRPDHVARPKNLPQSEKVRLYSALANGDRSLLKPTDREVFTLCPKFAWQNGEWNFDLWANAIEKCIALDKKVWLRPMSLGGYNKQKAIPSCFKKVNVGTRYENIDYEDASTWNALRNYYIEWHKQVFTRFNSSILAVDTVFAASFDTGQLSFWCDNPGKNFTLDTIRASKNSVQNEFNIQLNLFGKASVGHIYNWQFPEVDELFKSFGIGAVRQDNFPYKESTTVERELKRIGYPDDILIIGEISGGSLSDHFSGGSRNADLIKQWGSVENCYRHAKENKFFVWPMNTYPTKDRYPEWFSVYWENGADTYVPQRLEKFLKWKDESVDPPVDPIEPPIEPIDPPVLPIEPSCDCEENKDKIEELISTIEEHSFEIENISMKLEDLDDRVENIKNTLLEVADLLRDVSLP